ncbi:MAG: amidohydrolase [Gemmatimonadota bacterium]
MSRRERAGITSALALLSIALGACSASESGPPADTIFLGSNIVTMDPAQPTAEGVAVRGEEIVAVGSRAEVLALRGDDTQVVDLGERALLPGFIDTHGHFLAVGQTADLLALHPPPVGDVNNIDDIVAKIQRWITDKNLGPGDPVVGIGYDDSLLEEGRHPTRFDLDRASTDHPIILTHVSGHLTAVNSAALAVSGITAATPDPAGGHIRRVRGSMEPDGVLEEAAGGLVAQSAYRMGVDPDMDGMARKAIAVHTAYGITTIQNGGGTSPQIAEALRAASDRAPFEADLALFTSASAILNDSLQYERTYHNGMRIAGVKFVLDGSPQGRTAWVTQPYTEGPPGAPADYRAYPVMDPDAYKADALQLLHRGVPFLAHANGDAAMDLMLAGVEEGVAGMDPMPDHRSVIIHAQLMRADQLDRAARLGVVPSFFAAHPFFWGDWHLRSFGEQRGENISPIRWAIDRGVHFTIHNDAPVVPPDIMRLVWVAVNRKTRSGHVLGPNQRATIQEALNAVTLGAAYQYFEEDRKGSITVGKQADLVVLEHNPLTTDPEQLDRIQVMETFSRGRSVFSR